MKTYKVFYATKDGKERWISWPLKGYLADWDNLKGLAEFQGYTNVRQANSSDEVQTVTEEELKAIAPKTRKEIEK